MRQENEAGSWLARPTSDIRLVRIGIVGVLVMMLLALASPGVAHTITKSGSGSAGVCTFSGSNELVHGTGTSSASATATNGLCTEVQAKVYGYYCSGFVADTDIFHASAGMFHFFWQGDGWKSQHNGRTSGWIGWTFSGHGDLECWV